jgi:pimeloyl-ACP methyl ester carboxylesterase
MARARRLVAVGLVATLAVSLLAACGGGAGSRPAAPSSVPDSAPGSTVRWSSCRGTAGPHSYQCATVQVPRDPSHPDGVTIGMAIDRRRATGNKIGSLLFNPGGPGESGVDYLPYLVAVMPAALLSRFDIVGFDPPGVARTAPISCLDNAGLAQFFHVDPAPPTPAGVNALLAADRTLAAGCEAHSAAELPYVSTADAARDMDVLRADLGDSHLTYLGFSYGSLLGATYAGLFPTRVRAMVLDGVLDPALPTITEVNQQAASIEDQLQQFLAACSLQSSCAWKPVGSPIAAFEALLAEVRTSPLPARGTSRRVGPSEFLYGAANALYSTSTWDDLADSLQAASRGDGTGLLALFDAYVQRNPDGSYSNLFEANAAVNCLDTPAPSLAVIAADAPAAEAAAPVFGLLTLYGAAGCTGWPVPATGRIAPIRAAGSPPIVVVGSTGDPITPYRWAQSLASELEHGVLLTRVGDGHTAYDYSSCIRADVDQYLISLAVPPAGTRCASN